MKYMSSIISVLVLSCATFALSVYAAEVKQAGTTTAAPGVKPDIKADTIPATIGDGIKVKSFVATVGADGIQHVEITGGEYYFDPNYIVVKVNVPVEFKVKKAAGYIPHDIVVKAPQAGIDFKTNMSKEWQTVTFTPTKVGKYEMECDKRIWPFKSHRDRGMDGLIEVVP